MMKKVIMIVSLITTMLYPWSGKESAESKNVNFYGTIETHEGQVWNVQNIAFGKDRESARVKKIIMYDAPKEYMRDVDGKCILTRNPGDMTYSEIDLSEINSVQVLHPSAAWIYKEDKKKYGIEYREVVVIHKDGKKNNYLMELGREDIPHKAKLFCSVRHPHSHGDIKNKHIKAKSAESTKEYTICDGVNIDELEEKGVPIQAIKKITFEGFCHQVLVQ